MLDNELVFNEAIIEEREQGIQEIQHQISEVNEIFKDLAVLVHDQGAMIGKSCISYTNFDFLFLEHLLENFFKALSTWLYKMPNMCSFQTILVPT